MAEFPEGKKSRNPLIFSMKVAVGSQNPVKIEAAQKAFNKVFGECKIVGVSVPSGVSDMPLSFNEAARGARNRAKAAIKKLKADFGVGLEDGFEETKTGTFLCCVVAVVDKKGRGVLEKGVEF